MANLIEPEPEGAENGEDDTIGDDTLDYEEEELANTNDGVMLSRSLVIQRLLLTPRQNEQSQRHNIFRTYCIVHQKVCELMVVVEKTSCLR